MIKKYIFDHNRYTIDLLRKNISMLTTMILYWKYTKYITQYTMSLSTHVLMYIVSEWRNFAKLIVFLFVNTIRVLF